MLLAIAAFEARCRLKLISTWVYFLVFFGFAFMAALAAGGVFKNATVAFGGDKVFINAPMSVLQIVTTLSLLGLLVVGGVMGRTIQQDFEHDVHPFFFSAPITKLQYLGGRFAGGLVTLGVIFSSIGLGYRAGLLWPTLEAERIGPAVPWTWILPYAISILPNLFVLGAIFFAIAALTRRMFPVYVSSVVLLVGYLASGRLMADLDKRRLASLLDPFGLRAMSNLSEYWTVAEHNTRLVPLEGDLLWNRILWLAVGLAVLGLCYARFSFAARLKGGAKRPPEEEHALRPPPAPLPRVEPSFGRWGQLGLLPGVTWLALRETVKNVYFAVIVLAGLLFVFFTASSMDSLFGTAIWPVTQQVLSLVRGTFAVFFVIIITFCSGELLWRERDARMAQIQDALPVASWVPLAGKLLALMGVQALLAVVLAVAGMTIQVAKGYYRLEPGLYLHGLFALDLLEYCQLCVLAFAVHVVVNHKYLGHLVMVLYYAATVFAEPLGLQHLLYRYGEAPSRPYSDMNGYGHFLGGVRWFHAYWSAAALGLALLTHLLWVRGTDEAPRVRLRLARQRLGPRVRAALAAAALLFTGTGAYIFYNTNVLNRFQTDFEQEELHAAYERKYKQHQQEPQPRVIDVKLAVDIEPTSRRAHIQGRLLLRNKTDRPVPAVHVTLDRRARVARLAVERAGEPTRDTELGFYSFPLPSPMAPGEERALDFDLTYAPRGFQVRPDLSELVYNGTFFNSGLLPQVGYQEGHELETDRDRRKHDLPAKERMPDRDDPAGRRNNYISSSADWVGFEATVSTSPDQIALAPGYLQREWTEGGRRYFHYKMDAPILNFYAFLSARWAVKRDLWKDVPIEIYYHPTHTFNVDRMIEATKASLEYFTAAFGPYQHRQVRILEFPRYARFAQSFPNTIPYSEAVGFIARVDEEDPDDIDYPYFVTAHEVAHQWWAHQVIGGHVQGATVLSETLAEYSALMVMKRKYGAERMRKFLRYELDRYLHGRALEPKKELPLARVENQTYIHYAKGGFVMYSLADSLGEEAVNAALARFLKAHAYQGPPYPGSSELVAALREATPPRLQYLIDDGFETITLYENRARKATSRRRPDGKYEVTLTASAKKVRAGELGEQTEVPLNDEIELGLLDDEQRPIVLVRVRVNTPEVEHTFVLDRLPARAGIDPVHKLIDRTPRDNTVKVEPL